MQNDKLMFRIYFEKTLEKENATVELEIEDVVLNVANLLHFLGKAKQELESDMQNKKGGEQSEYEVHLQKLEAQIREHIRVGNLILDRTTVKAVCRKPSGQG